MTRLLPRIVAAMTLAAPAVAADATGFVNKVHTNPDGHKSPYVVFVPHAYDGKAPTPVILFLHGAGETKGGAKMPVQQGIGTYIKKVEKTFPFLVVIPQAEEQGRNVPRRWAADAPDGKRAVAMLDATLKEYPAADPTRQYLTGLSMGGFGTWNMAAAYPDRWAAIVPICGGGDPQSAAKFKDVPCWAFHGEKDPVVPAELSRKMVAALKAAGGAPKYTEFPGVDHFSWDKAYATEELYPWLLSHAKKK